MESTGYFIWPSYDSRYVTSYFGTRFHPILQVYKSHSGVDIGASYGSAIIAADSGTVIEASYDSGYGNYVINVKNTKGKITQSLFMIDSHSYTDGDYLGLFWKYDAIHPNQVQWYKDTVKSLTEENGGARPNSLAFFHIPLIEMSDAFNEYREAGEKDTENVKYKYGIIGEGDFVICTSQHNNGMFDAFKENGTTGMFFGHDHLNNMSLNYKGVQMTYGYSVDYLAYSGINKFGLQRGCTVITVKPDGTFDNVKENYYQDKYKPVNPKEQVDLEHEMKDVSDNAGAVFEFQKNNNNAG